MATWRRNRQARGNRRAMKSQDQWRIAYAKQALADLLARERLLTHRDVPQCQQLHFLQMACEKMCKAYLCGHGADPNTLRSHAYVQKVLPKVVSNRLALEKRKAAQDSVIEPIRALARQIELLAPAVDNAGSHPANCEYPWTGPGGRIMVPAEHNFGMDLLYAKVGKNLLKQLYVAGRELSETKPSKRH
jgi:hypothetical protein